MVDMAGRRLWESFNSVTGGAKGEVLFLFNEVCLYLAGYSQRCLLNLNLARFPFVSAVSS